MKTVEIRVRLTAKVPDEVEPYNLFVGFDLPSIKVMDISTLTHIPLAKVVEYETMEAADIETAPPHTETIIDKAAHP